MIICVVYIIVMLLSFPPLFSLFDLQCTLIALTHAQSGNRFINQLYLLRTWRPLHLNLDVWKSSCTLPPIRRYIKAC